jgi:hypothetical protein
MHCSKNKYFVRDCIENTLSQLGYFYKANKANRKTVKDYFNSLPYFFFDNETQNILFKIIKKSDFTSYIDKQITFRVVCYEIYKDFCIEYGTSFKTYLEFYGDLEFKTFSHDYYIKKEKQNHIHSYILFLLIISLVTFYYWFAKKNI